MKIIHGIENLKRRFKNPVVTVGVFDGVHLGHRKMLLSAVRCARRIGGVSVAVTFDPHPLKVLPVRPSPILLSSISQRLRLIAETEIDVTLVIRFTKRFAKFSSSDFIRRILVEKIGMRELYVGSDFLFGQKRRGDIDFLKSQGLRFSFNVHPLKIVRRGGTVVSSTRIRSLILKGEFEKAERLLGRRVSLFGKVVKGETLGRRLGYPTANILLYQEVIPPRGVYAVEVEFRGRSYQGLLNIGNKPTFPKKKFALEVYILDFSGDIYGKDIEVCFIRKIRNERKFASKEALAKQIGKDIRTSPFEKGGLRGI